MFTKTYVEAFYQQASKIHSFPCMFCYKSSRHKRSSEKKLSTKFQKVPKKALEENFLASKVTGYTLAAY